jgi:hypothetical protein
VHVVPADFECEEVPIIRDGSKMPMKHTQWPRGLRHELSSPAPTLGSWGRIPLRHGCLCVFCVCANFELNLLVNHNEK